MTETITAYIMTLWLASGSALTIEVRNDDFCLRMAQYIVETPAGKAEFPEVRTIECRPKAEPPGDD